MIGDIVENLMGEINNEKTQRQFSGLMEPIYSRLRMSYYFVVFLLLLIILNLAYVSYSLSTMKAGA